MWACCSCRRRTRSLRTLWRQVAGGDDHAGDAVGADEAGGVLGRGQPQVAEAVALGLVALAGHADDPEAQIGVALHEVDEVGAFALGADDHDISEVAALPAGVGEPGPEDRPTHDQQHERQDAGEQCLAPAEGDANRPEAQVADDGEDEHAAEQAGHLHRADRGDARQVELVGPDDEQAHGHAADDEEPVTEPVPLVVVGQQQERDHPAQQQARRRRRSPGRRGSLLRRSQTRARPERGSADCWRGSISSMTATSFTIATTPRLSSPPQSHRDRSPATAPR